MRQDPQAGALSQPLEKGGQLGRFLLVDRLEQSGAVSTFAAYDPQLDRKVALKVFAGQSEAVIPPGATAQSRLKHPNVLPIYELGSAGGAVFFAMELVEGQTLRQWLKSSPRTGRQVVQVFADAGRGLAAAHTAALFHGDFRSDLVLVGKDGRVQVTEFGSADPSSGATSDAASDQLAFFRALREAFAPSRKDSGRREPGWLRPIIDRGLAERAADRFPSMAAALEALESSPRRRRRQVWTAATIAASVAIAGVVWGSVVQRRAICSNAPERLAGAWDSSVQGGLRARYAALKKPWADEAAAIIDRGLGRYAGEWSEMYRGACEATRVRGDQSEAVLALRMACLDKRLAEVSALTKLLGFGDDAALAGGVDAVNELSAISSCADIALLSAPLTIPDQPEIRARVAEVNAKLAEAKVNRDAGRVPQALKIAVEAERASRDIGYPPLQAAALRMLGRLQMLSRDFKAGEESLRRAVNAADAGRDDAERVRAMAELEIAVGFGQSRFEEGLWWGRAGEALLRRIGGNDALQLELSDKTGSVYLAQGKYPEALAQYQQAAVLADRVLDRHHPRRGRVLSNLATVYSQLGNLEKAKAIDLQVLEMFAASIGKANPLNAPTHLSLADLLERQRNHEAALQHVGEALRLYEQAYGEDSPNVANALIIGARVQLGQNHFQEALASAERALRLQRQAPNSEQNWIIADSEENLGRALLGLGRPGLAIDALERALNIRKRAGMTEAESAVTRLALAEALWLAGRDQVVARNEAQKARDGFKALGERERQAEADAWLKEHAVER